MTKFVQICTLKGIGGDQGNGKLLNITMVLTCIGHTIFLHFHFKSHRFSIIQMRKLRLRETKSFL